MDVTLAQYSSTVWQAWCVGLVFPLTAILHHALFYRGSCMINPFGQDYTALAVKQWLLRDPALAWAILIAVAAYLAGQTSLGWFLRVTVPAFVLGFVPLTIWIWDLPGSGRWICRHCHDDLLSVPKLGVIRTTHLYALGLFLFVLVLAFSLIAVS